MGPHFFQLCALENIGVKAEGNQTCLRVSSHARPSPVCALSYQVHYNLVHATIVKWGERVNNRNGPDLLSASQQLNRKQHLGKQGSSINYRAVWKWASSIKMRTNNGTQNNFYLQAFTVQPPEENNTCSWRSLGQITSMQKTQVWSSSHPPQQLLHNFVRRLQVQSSQLGERVPILDSHVRKRRLNFWMKQHVLFPPTVAVERRRGVYIFSLAFCVAADKSEKYPGVIFPVRLQTSASLEDDPRSRCNGGDLAEPTAGQSSSSTCLQISTIEVPKVSLVGKRLRFPTSHWRPLFPVSISC